ncbi:MAG: hypothetical protein JWL76_524 [Thermoleophilia bacterium]|nr:hypothetical protein [Thermoleophilia bacterium]
MCPPPEFRFDPNVDSILPVDEAWLVDPRILVKRIDPAGSLPFVNAYLAAVDELAARGYGCIPDPRAGDGAPRSLVATCIVYQATDDGPLRVAAESRELHLRLVCTMARTDGAFVGSELAVALEVADRLAGPNVDARLRFRALVRELFMNPAEARDPLAQLAELPRPQALDILETLTAMAQADGFLRLAEQRMLERVHEVLELPVPMADANMAPSVVRYVQPDAA